MITSAVVSHLKTGEDADTQLKSFERYKYNNHSVENKTVWIRIDYADEYSGKILVSMAYSIDSRTVCSVIAFAKEEAEITSELTVKWYEDFKCITLNYTQG